MRKYWLIFMELCFLYLRNMIKLYIYSLYWSIMLISIHNLEWLLNKFSSEIWKQLADDLTQYNSFFIYFVNVIYVSFFGACVFISTANNVMFLAVPMSSPQKLASFFLLMHIRNYKIRYFWCLRLEDLCFISVLWWYVNHFNEHEV